MDAKKYLKDYAGEADKFLDQFFARERRKAIKISPVAVEMIDRYHKFMKGGKKLRGAEIKLGYEIFGGQNQKEIIRASTSIEVLHSFLLMHDDFMDQDDLRRGQPTVHRQFEFLHKEEKLLRSSSHFGFSMAINMGDLGQFLSSRIILERQFPEKKKLEVLTRFSEVIAGVAFGQSLDMFYESQKGKKEEKVMLVHTYKTAHYTVTLPFQIGAILAGCSKNKLAAIKNYGLPVGIAFQIRDDELGIFSEEEKLGKPIGSDIREDKNTLLHIKALELGNKKEKEFIRYAYGNRNLTKSEVKRVREITVKTGALRYSQEMGKKLVVKGKKFVPQITPDPKFQEALYSFADFMIERES